MKVSLRLVHFTADALQLLSSRDIIDNIDQVECLAPLQSLAKSPAWILLNDDHCFQVIIIITIINITIIFIFVLRILFLLL